LPKIWKESEFDSTTTILLDDEARKFREFPDNGYIVPEFGPNEVLCEKKNTLDEIGNRLVDIANTIKNSNKILDVKDFSAARMRMRAEAIRESNAIFIENVRKLTLDRENESDKIAAIDRKERGIMYNREMEKLMESDERWTAMVFEKSIGGVLCYRENSMVSTMEARVVKANLEYVYPQKIQLGLLVKNSASIEIRRI
jgi:hypothetical protein